MSTDLPADLAPDLIDGLGVRRATRVHGGDIASSYRLDTDDGPLFVKTHPQPKPDMFAREAAGLRALREHAPATLGVPEVLRASDRGLVLQWIDVAGGRPGQAVEEELGRGLAALHGTSHPTFGAIDDAMAGYLGSAEIDLSPTADWPEFFVDRRLRPLVEKAIGMGRLDRRARQLLEACAPRATELCGPVEPPALVHGDLWAGNRVVDRAGRNWLIDPACHWAHREIDLAMMALFGGFGPACFAAYDEAFPLAEGWPDRVSWYQLPPLLVHAILFGGGYGDSALAALRRYA
ncbi:MAG: fructosamine kinase family protein [Austwickia sp.]|jgi:fructosamine-3-kinase|nr:MAG: fructosamine kinase family protein [Austwickia sp.]